MRIGRILCLFGKHKWKRYTRWNGVRNGLEKVQLPRRACVRCGVRETVPLEDDMLELMRQNREYNERAMAEGVK